MSGRPMRKYEGSCHCGAIQFEILTDFREQTSYLLNSLTEQSCSRTSF